MEKTPLWAKLIGQMKKRKWLEIMIYVLLIGGIALTYFTGNAPKTAEAPQQAANSAPEEEGMESRLKRALESIRGAGEVEVLVTYESGPELVPAMSTEKQRSTSRDTRSEQEGVTESESETDKPMTLNKNGSDEPLVLTEKQPQIRGVIVIAQGAGDVRVRMDLTRAVMVALGVDASRIEVFTKTQ